jgi:group II intron reverse transcriptase/maturase
MAKDLTRIGEKARKEPKTCFTSIYHFVTDQEHLRDCYKQTERKKAAGVDGVTKEKYGEDLESNLQDLSERLARMGYRPKPVLRRYIPKPGTTKKRPLGLPSFEDKLVQKAQAKVLEQIYEADFLDCSYGYRPGRTQHQALDKLGRIIQGQKINYVVDADIQGFFDQLNQEWLLKFLGVRVGDQRVLRLVRRILRSGIMEDGVEKASDQGTPQGGSLSSLLSNVYLHYVLDLWFERKYRKSCRGECELVRFADDFVVCFQHRSEAERFLRELRQRLEKFNLQLAESKTKLLAFGRFARRNASPRGRKPGTFDFLGFTHYCGTTQRGYFKVKRKTSTKKFRAKLAEQKEWLKKQRHREKAGALLKKAKSKLEGHFNYYAITDNGPRCSAYRHQFERLLFKWLNRRSQRRSYTWEQFRQALAWVRLPQMRVQHDLNPCREVGPE